jgi:radical SAM superfamily enzyme YgiQ (UPF0313 family)
VDSYSAVFERIHRSGMAVLGAFIFGMDGDTLHKLEMRGDYMICSAVDVMQTTYLTPLPGTRLFDRLKKEKRLLYTNFPQDWTHYDMTEVVFLPGKMGKEDLICGMRSANKKMYSSPVLIRKAIKTYLLTKNGMAAMFAWSSNQNYKHVYENN